MPSLLILFSEAGVEKVIPRFPGFCLACRWVARTWGSHGPLSLSLLHQHANHEGEWGSDDGVKKYDSNLILWLSVSACRWVITPWGRSLLVFSLWNLPQSRSAYWICDHVFLLSVCMCVRERHIQLWPCFPGRYMPVVCISTPNTGLMLFFWKMNSEVSVAHCLTVVSSSLSGQMAPTSSSHLHRNSSSQLGPELTPAVSSVQTNHMFPAPSERQNLAWTQAKATNMTGKALKYTRKWNRVSLPTSLLLFCYLKNLKVNEAPKYREVEWSEGPLWRSVQRMHKKKRKGQASISFACWRPL